MLAANQIFANQFPSLQGLQSTLLCQSDGFVPISVDGGSGYIITEGKLPYILLSPPGCCYKDGNNCTICNSTADLL